MKLLLLLCALLSLSLVLSTTHLREKPEAAPAKPSYGYKSHGEEWGGTCPTGHEQSPINIETDAVVDDDDLIFDLAFGAGRKKLVVGDEGVTLKTPWTGSYLYASDVDGVVTGYRSAQFHFHAPSEHQVNGRHYDLEMHIVHEMTQPFVKKGLQSRKYAALGILFEVDDSARPNPFLNALHLEEVEEPVFVDMKHLLERQLPSPLTYFTYKGSLTTPDCPEVVTWFLIEKPLKITSEQLSLFTKRYSGNPDFANGNGNNRKVQPVYDRVVKRGTSE